MLKEHKLKLTHSRGEYQLDLQYTRLEHGLYFLSVKINSTAEVEFIQIAEKSMIGL